MPARRLLPVLAALTLAAGCGLLGSRSSGPGGQSPGPAATGAGLVSGSPIARCGITQTAAGVVVQIEIMHGPVACVDALAVERDYARALASGKVPGNGGGAPANVRGWVCRGFPTPQVLATGQTSSCRKGGALILAVLQMPTATPSS